MGKDSLVWKGEKEAFLPSLVILPSNEIISRPLINTDFNILVIDFKKL